MEKRQRVVVYGDSVILAGVEARIRQDPDTEVIDHVPTGCGQDLVELHPDIVIFDVGDVRGDQLLPQLQLQPGLLLVGLDCESHDVLLTGQAAHSITLDQITRIMRSRDRGPGPVPPRSARRARVGRA